MKSLAHSRCLKEGAVPGFLKAASGVLPAPPQEALPDNAIWSWLPLLYDLHLWLTSQPYPISPLRL
jgi:hypothetical protein